MELCGTSRFQKSEAHGSPRSTGQEGHVSKRGTVKARVSCSVITLEVGLVGGIFATPVGAPLRRHANDNSPLGCVFSFDEAAGYLGMSRRAFPK
jgi:hypothetical protein